MTTPDSKYKHKPSEKHTLEEVLKSLQDLIRNDLLDKDQTAAATETTHAASTQPKEQPSHERIVLTQEDFAPTNSTAGPVNLDAVVRSLKDIIGNELNVGDELVPAETAPITPAFEQQDAVESTSDEFLSLDEELNATGATYSEKSIAPSLEQPATNEIAPEDFIPLDEELTFGESTDIAPLLPALSTTLNLPGEISPELLGRLEEVTPLEVFQPKPENKIAPGTQQELVLDEPLLSASEHKPAAIDLAPEIELERRTAPALTDIAPEIVSEPPAENANKIAEEPLPVIEVEETFDASAYFETEAQQAVLPPPEVQEVQEIIASALDTPLASENLPPTPGSSSSETLSKDLAPVLKPDKAPADMAVKLELFEEQGTETHQNTSLVDFDTIDIDLPLEDRGPSSLIIKTPALAEEASLATVEPPGAQEAAHESETRVEVPSSPEVIAEKSEPEAGAVPNGMATPSHPGETHKLTKEIGLTESKPEFNLDDIPVLSEVVAPPAGSTLVAKLASPVAEPPMPAPDRARDIVVRAVAKLNVEMRKTGGSGLDTKTILRLQQLIRQELEKDGDKS